METVDNVYKNLFRRILKRTYEKILSDEKIEERVSYFISKLRNIDQQKIFKNLLYNDTSFEIGKLALDYRLRFISDDYKNVIDEASSVEIDQSNISDFLNRQINGVSSIINHAINKFILNGKINDDDFIKYEESKKEINDVFEVELHESLPGIYIENNYVHFYMTHNQAVYSGIYNINPYNDEPLLEATINFIKHSFNSRWKIFEILKRKYPTCIQDELVKNSVFFG